MKALEKAARALTDADAEFGYSLQLTRLVDGVSTYTLTISDGTPPVELSYDEGQDIIAHKKALIRARAVIASIEVDDAMVEAACAECDLDWNLRSSMSKHGLRRNMSAALKAFLHSILVDGEGR